MRPRWSASLAEFPVLTPEIQSRILALHYGEHRTARSIARELRINRKSVMGVIRRRSVRMETQAPTSPRKSILDPYKAVIQQKLLRDPGIPATAIHQAIRKNGFTGSERRVREYVRDIRVDPKPREAFLKLTFESGECAQVDWGEFGDVFNDGRKIHAFVMVLCYSRRIYVEFTRSERFEDFIRAHERAFRAFKGVPKECWYDNLASAVTERMGKLVRFNARFLAYLGHHGIAPYACTPASGNEKGRVEDGVKYIRSSFWAGRQFKDFTDLQAQCAEWVNEYANRREHRATRRIPELVFEHEESKNLLPLNPHPYGTDEVLSKEVPPQFHFVFETNQYSVPWTLVGMVVTLRISDDEVRVYYGEKQVAGHARNYGKNKIFTISEHQAGLLERKGGADHHTWQVALVKRSGESLERYVKLVASGHRSLRTEIKRLVALITIYGAEAVNAASAELLVRGVVGADNLEMLLKLQGAREEAPEPMSFQTPKLNRMTGVPNLSGYDAYLFETEKEEIENGEPGKPVERSDGTETEEF